MTAFTLADLEAIVADRMKAGATDSYTAKLASRGVSHAAKKLGEEATETVIAAIGEDDERLTSEAADLLYHLVVTLHIRGVSLSAVMDQLGARTGQSGLAEKASRRDRGPVTGAGGAGT